MLTFIKHRPTTSHTIEKDNLVNQLTCKHGTLSIFFAPPSRPGRPNGGQPRYIPQRDRCTPEFHNGGYSPYQIQNMATLLQLQP